MHRGRGLSYKEIAARLKVSVSMVEKYITRLYCYLPPHMA
ncbi:hypothetical protein F0L74_27700 [Chitinophaga agrisoli]|uniref:RNA polymerase sigma factor 70 region 4 type 2 domain-containing protein n=1 Tax=Chitinophaga agrisoli TaxID=2607653 RepID=A0A5B2VMU1_9BACT|nr:hypothetical protein F0L74_27700 [Chitinophaga agrisoli]